MAAFSRRARSITNTSKFSFLIVTAGANKIDFLNDFTEKVFFGGGLGETALKARRPEGTHGATSSK